MSTPQTTTAVARVAARNTFLQGLLAAALIGACTGVLQATDAGDFTWATVGTGAATAALASIVAYLQHAYAAPYLAIRKQAHGDAAEE